MNLVVLIGRLATDTKMTYSGELAICKFTLAVDKEGKDKGANFIRVSCFGKTAENVDRFVNKGRQIAVRGRIETGSYEGKNGKVYTTEVIADRVEFINSMKPKEEQPKEEEFEGFTSTDDDIPF